MYFGAQTYYTLKVSHTAFLLKSCKVVYICKMDLKSKKGKGSLDLSPVGENRMFIILIFLY